MKKFLIKLCLVSFAVCCFGIEKENINSVVQKDLNQAVIIIKQPTSLTQKSQKLFEMFDGYFDYARMAHIALGAHTKALNAEQIKLFEREFVAKLKESFVEKLSLYTNQRFVVAQSFAPPKPKNRYFVDVDIVGGTQTYKLNFKLYTKEAANDYLVYDVEVVGVSVVGLYRSQLANIKTGDLDALIAAVKQTSVAVK